MKVKKESPILNWVKRHKHEFGAYCGLLFCIVLFSVVPPLRGKSIWEAEKLATLMSNVIVNSLLSVGAVFVYAMGNMDVSIGKQVGLYATLIVALGNATGSLLPGILVSIVIAIIIGAANGAIGELLHIHPVVSSVAFMMALSGVSTVTYNALGSRNVGLKTIDYHLFKEPWLMVVALVVEIIIITYLFNYTKYGKNAKAIGANPVAAQQSGINLVKFKVISYVIMGFCVVLASLFQMGFTGSASDSTGTGFEMNVMVALILGGMPLNGGMRSKVSCAVVGSFTLGLLAVGLPLIGVKANQVFIIKAVIFLIVVLITCRKKDGTLPR